MKKVVAKLIDFFLIVFGWGWLLTKIQGSKKTFELYDIWLLIWIVGMVAYYVGLKKLKKKTVGQMLMKV